MGHRQLHTARVTTAELFTYIFGLWPLVFGLRRVFPADCSCRLLLPTAPAYCAAYCAAYCPCTFLLPGLTANSPRAQASQTVGSTDGTLRLASAIRRTPTSAAPKDRSIIEAAATTFAPFACSATTVSRVEPPVVTTSSTIKTLSPGVTEKPRRSV